MERKKIVFIIYSLRGGGAERVASELLNEWVKIHEVILLLLSDQPIFYEIDARIKQYKPTIRKERSLKKIVYLLRLSKYIRSVNKKEKPDAVYSFGESINSFVLLSLWGLKSKKFVSNRASPLSNIKGFRGTVNPIVYPLADKVILQTKKAIEILTPKYRKTNFTCIPNPITLETKPVPILEREKIIISVGYLGGKKNQEELIKIFASTQPLSEWRLLIVGDGPNRSYLENLVKSHNLLDKVQLLGQRKDVHELLNNAQIFAFTSLTEGFPNALAEALASGCVCISYDIITGPSELINNGVNGFLIEAGDQMTFSKKLNLLIENTELRISFSHHALRSMEKYNRREIATKFLNLID